MPERARLLLAIVQLAILLIGGRLAVALARKRVGKTRMQVKRSGRFAAT
jgi:hypothetical protein